MSACTCLLACAGGMWRVQEECFGDGSLMFFSHFATCQAAFAVGSVVTISSSSCATLRRGMSVH